MSAPASPARNLRERLAADRRANKDGLRDISPEPAATAPPDMQAKLRASSALLKHVQSMRHVDFGLYQALRERQEIAQLSSDPNVLLQEIARQKAGLEAAGLDKPSLSWRLRNACNRLGLNGGPKVNLPLFSKIVFNLLLALYVLLSAAFFYSTSIFRNPAPEVWLIYAGVALGIAWVLRAPYSRKEGIGLVVMAATLMGLNATYCAHVVWPVSSFFIAVWLVCGSREHRYVTARIIKNMPAVGWIPRYATDEIVYLAAFAKPSDRIVYQLSAVVALFFGIWVPMFWYSWLLALFVVPIPVKWFTRTLWITTKRYRNLEGDERYELLIINGQEQWVKRGSKKSGPATVYADTPVPNRPAEVEHVPVFNQGTGQYEFEQKFRRGNPNVKPPVEPLPPSTVGGSAYEMTDKEGDAKGLTCSDLNIPPIR